jgi:hypothetical protein
MIVWLASYPRSGNTMLRTMMQQVFGLKSYSAYDDADSVGLLPEIREKTGHAFLGESFDAFYKRNRSSGEVFLVKTHHPPVDAERAIYIVRDGRSAIVSRYNLLVNLRRRTDVSIADIIRGKVVFGDWSSHLRAWAPLNRPATLLLRYHDLLQRPAEAMDRVAAFIQQTPIRIWENNFEELHRIFPQFFHGGSDEKNLAQMTSQEHQLFWTLHRECMQRYGLGAP